jgi:cobalamin biosynthesis protein CobT
MNNKMVLAYDADADSLSDALKKAISGGGGTGKSDTKPEPGKSSPGATKPMAEPDKVFDAKLRSVMSDNKFDRRIPRRKKGKLDPKALWKTAVRSESVFTQKQERKNKKYHVVLLVDRSGSMYDDSDHSMSKIGKAAETAVFIGKSLEKIGVECTILGFNCRLRTYKRRDQKIDSKRLFSQMTASTHGEGENHDFQALVKSYRKLEKDKHGKVLMVFSDGAPATCAYECYPMDGDGIENLTSKNSSSEDHCQTIRNLVTNHKDVATIGVGIESHYVEKIYPNHVLVDDLGDFKKKVVGALRKAIRRG